MYKNLQYIKYLLVQYLMNSENTIILKQPVFKYTFYILENDDINTMYLTLEKSLCVIIIFIFKKTTFFNQPYSQSIPELIKLNFPHPNICLLKMTGDYLL